MSNDIEFLEKATLSIISDFEELDSQLNVWSLNNTLIEHTGSKEIKASAKNMIKSIIEDSDFPSKNKLLESSSYGRCFAKASFSKGGAYAKAGYSKKC